MESRLRVTSASGPGGPKKIEFGLPYRLPENEDAAAQQERLSLVHDLIVEATAAVTRQLGEDEAKERFRLAFQKPPAGRPPDEIENAALLSAYDRMVERGVSPQRAARVAAGEMIVGEEDPESIARRIRRIVTARGEENAVVIQQEAYDLLWFEAARTVLRAYSRLVPLINSDKIARSP